MSTSIQETTFTKQLFPFHKLKKLDKMQPTPDWGIKHERQTRQKSSKLLDKPSSALQPLSRWWPGWANRVSQEADWLRVVESNHLRFGLSRLGSHSPPLPSALWFCVVFHQLSRYASIVLCPHLLRHWMILLLARPIWTSIVLGDIFMFFIAWGASE